MKIIADEAVTPDQNTPTEVPATSAAPIPDETNAASARPISDSSPALRADAPSKRPIFPFNQLKTYVISRKGLYIAFACTLVLIIAGGGAVWFRRARPTATHPTSRFAAVVIHFKVDDTTPSDGQRDVTDASRIVLNFNRAVDPQKLNGDFFVAPTTAGVFSAGSNDHQAIFTPQKPFPQGTAVQVMIHGEFQSKDGSKLGADYTFKFTTLTPDFGVNFSRGGAYDTLGSVRAGDQQTYTLNAGNQVTQNNTVTIYKSTTDELLRSLSYTPQTDGLYAGQKFIFSDIDTSGLTPLTTKTALANNGSFTFTPEQGIYVLVATNKGRQVGHAWLVASNFGAIVKQDDQQVVIAVRDFHSQTAIDANITLYNLNGGVQKLNETKIHDIDTVKLPLHPSLDIAVVTHGNDTAMVPVSTYLTFADIRVQKDLGSSALIYGLTDKPTYAVGDVVRYAGFIRTDNDANYQPATTTAIQLYVSDTATGTHFADNNVPVQPNGVIDTSFKISAHAIPAGQSNAQLFVYNGSAANQTDAATPIGTFNLTTTTSTKYRLQVRFPKASYVANDTISAQITALQPDQTPLPNQKVSVDIYAKEYYEASPTDNAISISTYGTKITDTPIVVMLNSQGQASIPIDVSKLHEGSSQVVTVQSNFTDPQSVAVVGGASTKIHEGDGVLQFGPSRTVVSSGDKVVGRLYARTLDGKPLTNAVISYNVTPNESTTNTFVPSGSITTDTNGYAEINQTISGYPGGTNLTLKAWTADQYNNKITASQYFYVRSTAESASFSDAQLSGMDISGSPSAVTVGQHLVLTVGAPQQVQAVVTLERGRIHKYESVNLAPGKNSYSLTISDDLAPSFSLMFSYFANGSYHNEGTTFTVTPESKAAVLNLSVDDALPSVQSRSVAIKVRDNNGNPLRSSIILAAVSATAYDLNETVVPDIFAYFYNPRQTTINVSSSLTGIGSGGGKCGGGGGDVPVLVNPLGTVASWQSSLTTDDQGIITAQVTLPKGAWRISAYGIGVNNEVGSAYTTVVIP